MKDIGFVAVLDNKEECLNSYRQLLEREKCHFSNSINCNTKLVFTNQQIDDDEILLFLSNGGIVFAENQNSLDKLNICVEEEVLITEIFFEKYGLVNAVYPTIAKKYLVNENSIDKIGYLKTHEKRIVKHGMNIGVFPLIEKIKVGNGILYLSSVKFANYLNYNGSTLRSIKNKTSQTDISERISQIDKGLISKFLITVFDEIFKEANIPTVKFDYLPEKNSKMFIFRMDLDGTPNSHTINDVVQLCNKYGIPGTFFANKFYMETSQNYKEQMQSINKDNEIGNHGLVHNIYDDYEDNLKNITGCNDWVEEISGKCTGFVAPRGIWNPTLDMALNEAGFDYSSDFGISFNDLPFRPYINGKPSPILQIPVNPYCVGRAEIYKQESSLPPLEDKEVIEYYKEYMKDETGEMGNGLVYIYGHPQGLGKRLNVIEEIFKIVRNENYTIVSLRSFKDWWLFREKIDFSIVEGTSGVYNLIIDDEFTPFIKEHSENLIVKSIKK